jgi:hypothetical protein
MRNSYNCNVINLVFQYVTEQAMLDADFPPRRPRQEPGSGHVGFVGDEVALSQGSSVYFGVPCQFTFHRLLHNHHLSSGAGTIGQ